MKNLPIIKAGIIFLDKSSNAFLALHPTGDSKTLLSIPKGVVECGESPLFGAIRELKEETGIILSERTDKICSLGFINYGRKKPKTLFGFLFVTNMFDKKITLCWENDFYRWLSFEESPRDLYPSQRILVNRAIKLLDS
jgi:8-oxo-dGTP pyrophosphatase MutT (NUDIX family)